MAVALGVGNVVERSVLLFHAVKLADATYLMFLGAKAVRATWRSRAVGTVSPRGHPPAAPGVRSGRGSWSG
ncbi:hypothetical protein [Streptomyces sp. NPDC018322]|uniref:hypothetical protein n=1 Tax=Streptomyces sp. NPDC018322 TaxID=3365044 RepID=UPI0037AE5961